MSLKLKKLLRVHDLTDKYGEAPGDLVGAQYEATLVSGDASLHTPFQPGTVVEYAMRKKATVDSSGDITVSNDAIGDTDTVIVTIFSQSTNLQGGI